MRRFPLHAFTTCSVLLIGCQSALAPVQTTPPPPPGQSLSFEISGPSQIDNSGSYSWEAFAFGGSGAYQYEWVVTNQAGQLVTTDTDRRLGLLITDTDGDILLTVKVTSGNELRVETFDVRNCISGCVGTL